MSREIRRVPKNWQHPEGKSLYGDGFNAALAEWLLGSQQWDLGMIRDYSDFPEVKWEPKGRTAAGCDSYKEWSGDQPAPADYMPDWPEAERTHFQMYETCSEGSPISPVLASPEEVARWCADNGASAFGSQTADYKSWLRVAYGGYVPSAVMGPETAKFVSGVEGLTSVLKV